MGKYEWLRNMPLPKFWDVMLSRQDATFEEWTHQYDNNPRPNRESMKVYLHDDTWMLPEGATEIHWVGKRCKHNHPPPDCKWCYYSA